MTTKKNIISEFKDIVSNIYKISTIKNNLLTCPFCNYEIIDSFDFIRHLRYKHYVLNDYTMFSDPRCFGIMNEYVMHDKFFQNNNGFFPSNLFDIRETLNETYHYFMQYSYHQKNFKPLYDFLFSFKYCKYKYYIELIEYALSHYNRIQYPIFFLSSLLNHPYEYKLFLLIYYYLNSKVKIFEISYTQDDYKVNEALKAIEGRYRKELITEALNEYLDKMYSVFGSNDGYLVIPNYNYSFYHYYSIANEWKKFYYHHHFRQNINPDTTNFCDILNQKEILTTPKIIILLKDRIITDYMLLNLSNSNWDYNENVFVNPNNLEFPTMIDYLATKDNNSQEHYRLNYTTYNVICMPNIISLINETLNFNDNFIYLPEYDFLLPDILHTLIYERIDLIIK